MENAELIKIARSTINCWDLSSSGATSGGVAAALVTDKGNVYTGVCIDTSCSMGYCAEHNAIGTMITNKENKIDKIVAVQWDGAVISPCGRCREFMYQVHDDNKHTDVILKDQVLKLSELLPHHWIEPNV